MEINTLDDIKTIDKELNKPKIQSEIKNIRILISNIRNLDDSDEEDIKLKELSDKLTQLSDELL